MRTILHSLEMAYHSPVDLEFTLQVETDPQVKQTFSSLCYSAAPRAT